MGLKELFKKGIDPGRNFEAEYRNIPCTDQARAIHKHLQDQGINSRIFYDRNRGHTYVVPDGAGGEDMPYNRIKNSTGERYFFDDPTVEELLNTGEDIT